MKKLINYFNLLLALGAFIVGGQMLLQNGLFETFPQEWVGVLPFQQWQSIAIFGIVVFGIGNSLTAYDGFFNKQNHYIVYTCMMGVLLMLSVLLTTYLTGVWYLPTGMLLIVSCVQIGFAISGKIVQIVSHKRQNPSLR